MSQAGLLVIPKAEERWMSKEESKGGSFSPASCQTEGEGGDDKSKVKVRTTRRFGWEEGKNEWVGVGGCA
jgi:hypothetical protein